MIRFLKPTPTASLVHRLKAEIGDPEMERLLDSWLRLMPGSALPDKAAFDPLEHSTLLPRMWIYELTGDRGDFVGRLCGEEIRHVWGQTTKGLPLSQISPPHRFRTSLRRWLYCVTAPAVLLGHSTEQAKFVVKRLSLPFTDSMGRLYLLGASRYDFGRVDPFEQRHPYRHSQSALAVRARDLAREAAAAKDQAAISSRTWAAQASPSA